MMRGNRARDRLIGFGAALESNEQFFGTKRTLTGGHSSNLCRAVVVFAWLMALAFGPEAYATFTGWMSASDGPVCTVTDSASSFTIMPTNSSPSFSSNT